MCDQAINRDQSPANRKQTKVLFGTSSISRTSYPTDFEIVTNDGVVHTHKILLDMYVPLFFKESPCKVNSDVKTVCILVDSFYANELCIDRDNVVQIMLLCHKMHLSSQSVHNAFLEHLELVAPHLPSDHSLRRFFEPKMSKVDENVYGGVTIKNSQKYVSLVDESNKLLIETPHVIERASSGYLWYTRTNFVGCIDIVDQEPEEHAVRNPILLSVHKNIALVFSKTLHIVQCSERNFSGNSQKQSTVLDLNVKASVVAQHCKLVWVHDKIRKELYCIDLETASVQSVAMGDFIQATLYCDSNYKFSAIEVNNKFYDANLQIAHSFTVSHKVNYPQVVKV